MVDRKDCNAIRDALRLDTNRRDVATLLPVLGVVPLEVEPLAWDDPGPDYRLAVEPSVLPASDIASGNLTALELRFC